MANHRHIFTKKKMIVTACVLVALVTAVTVGIVLLVRNPKKDPLKQVEDSSAFATENLVQMLKAEGFSEIETTDSFSMDSDVIANGTFSESDGQVDFVMGNANFMLNGSLYSWTAVGEYLDLARRAGKEEGKKNGVEPSILDREALEKSFEAFAERYEDAETQVYGEDDVVCGFAMSKQSQVAVFRNGDSVIMIQVASLAENDELENLLKAIDLPCP